ncbi:MAG: RluA family pseudouridine synthase [Treponemataceae bacterium]|nr:RluA family pseudouridine synthase [Treponemataceae bacterium]
MPRMQDIPILYEDPDCVILNKPAGLAVQGGVRIKNSLDILLESRWGAKVFLVHRLDRDTSGCILVAKNRQAAHKYQGVFSSRGLRKVYRALCSGPMHPGRGIIQEPLTLRGHIKAATTKYRCLQKNSQYSYVELELQTGRMHQIRRHLAFVGHPIVGDDKYGDFSLNKRLAKEYRLKHLLLHAYELEIPLFGEGRIIRVQAPLPDYFALFLQAVMNQGE